VNTDLSYYNWIIACEGEPVTAMARLLDREIDMAEVEDRIVENFETVFGYTAHDVSHESEPGALATDSDWCRHIDLKEVV
jgi:lipoate-protein ligase B